jgi:hypothetical protein
MFEGSLGLTAILVSNPPPIVVMLTEGKAVAAIDGACIVTCPVMAET